jgi:16S rRNA (guanine527-N7)-methyltransferase
MKTLGLFRRQIAAWGLNLPQHAEDLLCSFARLLATYDRANVIGTKNFDRVLLEHVLDSLSCLLSSPVAEAARAADVGSGGGLPGIPLAIALPHASLTLLESTRKKSAFLGHAAERLDLTNVEVANNRVESAAHDPSLRATYDVCTARAVARLSVLAEYCLPLLRVGGHAVAMKGPGSDEEYEEGERAARLLGGKLTQTIEVPLLPEMEQKTRRLIVLRKTAETSGVYPRRVGIPSKIPLGQR